MNVDIINTFLKSSDEILSQMCDLKIKRKNIYLKQGLNTVRNITVNIGIVGALKGNFIIEMNKSTVEKIASCIIKDNKISDMSEVSLSAISELGNMIGGHAVIELSDSNNKIDITPPVICTHNVGSKINYINKTICVSLDIIGLDEELDFNISLN